MLLAGMGYVYFQYCNTGIRTDEETARKAEEYTERALTLDPESPNAHIVLGLLKQSAPCRSPQHETISQVDEASEKGMGNL